MSSHSKSNTQNMSDLRDIVIRKVQEAMHGKEIDVLEEGMPELQHMLGIVPVGVIPSHESATGTILDPNHDFWDSYYKHITTRTGARTEVETALHSLKEDGKLIVTEPYGHEADILYVEVDMDGQDNQIVTPCVNCGQSANGTLTLDVVDGEYELSVNIVCTQCGYSEEVTP